MFSIITMASSTTKPVEIVSAISVRLFRLYPSRYMTANVPTSDSGTATLGMIVAGEVPQEQEDHHHHQADGQQQLELHVLRPRRGWWWSGRSGCATLTDAGSDALSCGSSFLTRSTTSMMLAPGWRWMFTMTAGVSFIQAASFASSAPSTTLATSESSTGAPLRYWR